MNGFRFGPCVLYDDASFFFHLGSASLGILVFCLISFRPSSLTPTGAAT